MINKRYFLIASLVFFSAKSISQDFVDFNTAFIKGENKNPKVLQSQTGIIEGKYYTQIIVNGKSKGRHEFYISKNEEISDKLCLSDELLSQIGVRLTAEANEMAKLKTNCFDLTRLDFALVDFDISKPALTISIPQQYIQQGANLQQHDRGINGVKLGYSLNGSVSNTNDDQVFGAFDTQINLGGWVIHSNSSSTLRYKQGFETNISTIYAKYALPEYKSDFSVGKGFTNSRIIDGVSYGGVSLASNQAMYMRASNNYIPDISGVANSISTITIRQNGRLLYSETISPGPYKIDNFSVYGSGDIEASIVDANGNVETKTYPVVVTSSLLRKDSFDYDLVVGKRFNQSGIDGLLESDRNFVFVGGRYGLDTMTLSGDALFDKKYQSVGFGSSFYLKELGSLSLESELTRAKFNSGEQKNGFSLGIEYDYLFSDQTNIQLAVFRYRDKDFVSYTSFNPNNNFVETQQQKQRMQIVVNTKLWDVNLGLQAWQQGYWGTESPTMGTSLTLNKSWVNGIYTNLAINYWKNNGVNDYTTMLMLSIPLDFGHERHFISSSMTRSSADEWAFSTSVSGSVDRNVNYSASAGDYGVSANLNYHNDTAQFSYGASYSNGSSAVTAGASGSLLWTQPTGLLATRTRSETVAIVDTQGIEKIKVNGIETNERGYTSVTTSAYRNNALKVDVTSIPIGTEVDTATQVVSPTEGAIIVRKIKARSVYQYTFRVKDRQGQKLNGGDLYVDDLYLGAIAPNGIATVSVTSRAKLINVFSDHGKCAIDVSHLEANIAKLFEVICE